MVVVGLCLKRSRWCHCAGTDVRARLTQKGIHMKHHRSKMKSNRHPSHPPRTRAPGYCCFLLLMQQLMLTRMPMQAAIETTINYQNSHNSCDSFFAFFVALFILVPLLELEDHGVI